MAVVQTESLLSFLITSLVHLTRMGSLAGILDNSKSLLGSSGNRKAHCLPIPSAGLVTSQQTPSGKSGQMSATNGSNDPC